MFAENGATSAGKHLILDIQNVQNLALLNNVEGMTRLLDRMCDKYNYTILHKNTHLFSPFGVTLLYMLSESHLSIHTFPEKGYAAFDLYTCRNYPNNDIYEEIRAHLLEEFQSTQSEYQIIERIF